MLPAAGCKARDLPWGVSSTVTSETTVPPGYSDVIPPLHGARPAAGLSADPVICTQYLKWTSKMVHLVGGRMPVEFIIQTRCLWKKGLLIITPGQPIRMETAQANRHVAMLARETCAVCLRFLFSRFAMETFSFPEAPPPGLYWLEVILSLYFEAKQICWRKCPSRCVAITTKKSHSHFAFSVWLEEMLELKK